MNWAVKQQQMPASSAVTKQPVWLAKLIYVTGMLSISLVVLFVLFFALYQLHRDAVEYGFTIAETYTRSLEDLITQTVKITDVLIANSMPLADLNDSAELSSLNHELNTAILHAPFIRSLSLTSQQQVHASSNPRNLGVEVNTIDYLPPCDTRTNILRIGAPWRGRDLADGTPSSPQHPISGDELALIPVYTLLPTAEQSGLFAALNPDFFINHMVSTIPETHGFAELVRSDGRVLLSSNPEHAIGVHRYSQYIDQFERTPFGRMSQALRGQQVISVYRVSAQYPFVVVVHLKQKHVFESFQRTATMLLVVIIPTWLVFLVLAELYHQRREKESQLQLSIAQAQQANQMKSAFLANMSHEIRTPMNAILGMTWLALQQPLDSQHQDYLNNIEQAAKSLLAIINDLLDFSKIEAGHLEIERLPFQLDQVIAGVLTQVQVLVENKQLRFVADISPATAQVLIGDPVRLRQILLNFMSNAVKFTPEAGLIQLTVAPLESTKNQSIRHEWRLCVKDTGIGMTPEQMADLFQPFTQADNSISRHYGGTGLGLSICQRLAELMDGRIELDSQLGQGSQFCLIVPLPPATADRTPVSLDTQMPPPADKPDCVLCNRACLANARVLLVEDNLVNQKVASGMLRNLGITPELANDGEQALERVADLLPHGGIDLILMDIQMPGMTGYDCTKQLRCNPVLATIPIVAMTAHAIQGERERCLAAGMNDHIAKPIDIAILTEVLVRWLSPKRCLQGQGQPPMTAGLLSTQDDATEALPHPFTEPLPGIDIADGVSRFGHDSDFFYETLLETAPVCLEKRSQLAAAVKENDAFAAQTIIHNMKGMAGNISAVRLFRAADQLEQALLTDLTVDLKQVEHLIAEYHAAFDELSASLEQLIAVNK